LQVQFCCLVEVKEAAKRHTFGKGMPHLNQNASLCLHKFAKNLIFFSFFLLQDTRQETQDLKDYARQADRNEGCIEFGSYKDLQTALVKESPSLVV